MKYFVIGSLIISSLIVFAFVYYRYRTRIHIYTITNVLEKEELKKLEASIKKQGGTLNVIFTKDKMGRLPVGFGPKVMRVYEAIRDRPNSDIICFVDGFDVLFGAPVAELRSKYLSMHLGNKVLFSAEMYGSCWPTEFQYKQYCEQYDKKGKAPLPGRYGYLNSGMYIGTVKGIKSIIEQRWMAINQMIDDQGFFGESYLFTDKIVLDKQCQVFQNLIGNQRRDLEWDESKKRWYNKNTKTYPVVFQGDGDQSSRDFLFNVIGPKVFSA